MNKKYLKTIKKIHTIYGIDDGGQVLLFAVVAMSIALAIGVAISSRTLSSLSRTTRTDTSSRVYAAAEGGIESYLNLSDARLEELAEAFENNNLDSATLGGCPEYTYVEGEGLELDGCKVEYQFPGENIVARAVVTVRKYKFNSPNNFLTININNGETKEVNVEGYNNPLRICWSNTSGNADLYLFTYDENGITSRRIIVRSDEPNSTYYTNNSGAGVVVDRAGASPPGTGFSYCRNGINLPSNSYGLRIKALYGNARVGIDPTLVASFPNQGYEIISKGELVQEDLTKSVRTVRVYKSLPYLPGVFDSAIYSEAAISN